MYKVFIEQKQVWLAQTPIISTAKSEIISGNQLSVKEVVRLALKLPAEKKIDCLIVIVDNVDNYWKDFKKEFRIEKAAGGVIENKKGEVLFIYRNGKWDLPKGKAEGKETSKETALREVEEECGVKGHKIESKLISTYHIYERKGKLNLKKTHWFRMSIDGEQNLVPQLDEGITKVEWLKKEKLNKVKKNTYSSIKRLLQSVDLI